MARFLTGISENPEERELRQRKQTFKRIRIMVVIFGLAVVARLAIKNPPPPKAPDYSKYSVRYVPGMLDAIPATERKKMDPRLLAKMIQADEDGKKNRLASTTAAVPKLGKGPYKPAETPLASQAAEETERQFTYRYTKQQNERLRQMDAEQQHTTTKTTVIQFATGGYIRVEKAFAGDHVCQIELDRSLRAQLPNNLIQNVRVDAAEWTPPIQKGFVALKPAKGISIVLNQQIAGRVTVAKIPLR